MSTYEPGTHTRCQTCETLFTNEALNALPPEEQGMCPACGTRSVPHDPALDVTLTLNWHDLRCLVIWAENYVMASKADQDWERAWEAIKRRINKHRPAGAVGLTLLDEIEEMRAEGYTVTLHEGKMNRPPESPTGDSASS